MRTKRERPTSSRFLLQQKYTQKKNYTLYRSLIKKEHKVQGRDNWVKFSNTVFETIGEMMVESEAGIFLKDLGYFFIWQTRQTGVFNVTPQVYVSQHRLKYRFSPIFQPVKKRNKALQNLWVMDGSFSKEIKAKLKGALRSGRNFRSYLYTFSTHYKRR